MGAGVGVERVAIWISGDGERTTFSRLEILSVALFSLQFADTRAFMILAVAVAVSVAVA